MIWIIVGIIVSYFLFRFLFDYNKDNDDIKQMPLHIKFDILIKDLNQSTFGGQGIVTIKGSRRFNLYLDGSDQIIMFSYGTGHLTIKWKYKLDNKEVVHERTYRHVRKISDVEQKRIANNMVLEMSEIKHKHLARLIKM